MKKIIAIVFTIIFLPMLVVSPGLPYIQFLFTNANNITQGTLGNARLDNSSVTLCGNTSIHLNGDGSITISSLTNTGVISSTSGINVGPSTITVLIVNGLLSAGNISVSSISLTGSLTSTNNVIAPNVVDPYSLVIGTSLSQFANFVGTDQTPFTSAVTQLGQTQGVIRVRAGTYTFTNEVDIANPNITLDFEKGAIIRAGQTNINCINTSGTVTGYLTMNTVSGWTNNFLLKLNSSATAENITLQDANIAADSSGQDAPFVLTGVNAHIRKLNMINTTYPNGNAGAKRLTRIIQCSGCSIDGGHVEDMNGTGGLIFFSIFQATDTLIQNMDIYGTTLNYVVRESQTGGTMVTHLNTQILNNNFTTYNQGDGTGVIQVSYGSGTVVSGNHFYNLGSFQTNDMAINIGGDSASTGTIVSNNYVTGFKTGVSIAGSGMTNSTGTFVHGNYFYGVTTGISDSGLNTHSRDNDVNGTMASDN